MQSTEPSVELIQAVAVTSELCGRVFSPEAARVFVDDLSGYDERQVLAALRRCRKEVRGLLTVQDVISRLDDGRPDVDEAYAVLPFDESKSVVWTDEMREAFFAALPAYTARDYVGARNAFRSVYTRRVTEARDRREPPRWTASLGTEVSGRQVALEDAVRRGRISIEYAQRLLPQAEGAIAPALGVQAPLKRLEAA